MGKITKLSELPITEDTIRLLWGNVPLSEIEGVGLNYIRCSRVVALQDLRFGDFLTYPEKRKKYLEFFKDADEKAGVKWDEKKFEIEVAFWREAETSAGHGKKRYSYVRANKEYEKLKKEFADTGIELILENVKEYLGKRKNI